jgi:hypothetical protein
VRGKKAKLLRRTALELCKAQGVPPGADAGKYHQIKNCHAWVPSGEQDSDGVDLLKHVLNPGTILHKNPFMRIYRQLKLYYARGRM